MSDDLIYTPTRERVTFVRVANEGQYRPGDPGSGMRLYAVKDSQGRMIQASASELGVRTGRSIKAFREELFTGTCQHVCKIHPATREATP